MGEEVLEVGGSLVLDGYERILEGITDLFNERFVRRLCNLCYFYFGFGLLQHIQTLLLLNYVDVRWKRKLFLYF